jgi:hypothetical protein
MFFHLPIQTGDIYIRVALLDGTGTGEQKYSNAYDAVEKTLRVVVRISCLFLRLERV